MVLSYPFLYDDIEIRCQTEGLDHSIRRIEKVVNLLGEDRFVYEVQVDLSTSRWVGPQRSKSSFSVSAVRVIPIELDSCLTSERMLYPHGCCSTGHAIPHVQPDTVLN